MSLSPESRVMLTDALRPSAGMRVDIAVGTTYSLGLTAMLLAPLSFALADTNDATALDTSGPDERDGATPEIDPVRLLEAVRRYADRTTVFCQAGGIHVPSNFRRILTFAEDSIIEVAAPRDDGIFHPKMWALRFTTPSGDLSHRVVVLSRNLTLDRSWDTVLVLDEDPDGTIDAAPAAAFVRRMPELALHGLDPARTRDIDDLADSLERVRLAAPDPYTGGTLLPLGAESGETDANARPGTTTDARSAAPTPPWPFPETARRMLAISPFVTGGMLQRLGSITRQRTLLSRPHTIDQLGTRSLTRWTARVLAQAAEGTDSVLEPQAKPENQASPADYAKPTDSLDPTRPAPNVVHDGLHAKTCLFDLGGNETLVVTGSANLTDAAWTRNVEFDATLTGPTHRIGVKATLEGGKGVQGLDRVLEPYTPADDEAVSDEAIDAQWRLERFHAELAALGPILRVTTLDDHDTVTHAAPGRSPSLEHSIAATPLDDPAARIAATLTIQVPDDAPTTRVWLCTVPGQAHPLTDAVEWRIAPDNVTPFIAVESEVGAGAQRQVRRCVVKAELVGDVGDRRSNAIAAVLRTKADVLRYLIFLLGDPSYDALFAELSGERSDGAFTSTGGDDVALFEPMMRAVGHEDSGLGRIASLVEDLAALPNGDDLIPDGFDDLWRVVWQAHAELRR